MWNDSCGQRTFVSLVDDTLGPSIGGVQASQLAA
jgi:hypothetical protein